MPTAFDEAFAQVKELVADFKANENFYLSAQFSEAQARKDFIDKFFIALGWDVNHDAQKNPYEQEVKIEKNESGSQRRADYAFFLSPNFHDIRFFSEAKKPHGEFGSVENYFQTLRYGWSGKTPLAILTNFDELHVLDSRFKPHIGDTLSRVVKKFSYADYADSEKFAEIYWLFSREAVANNSLAKRAEELPKPKSKIFRRELFKGGDQSPDEAFLIELDGYREMLAKAFKSKNPNLNSEQLTEVTQRTIDRLVFIRFLEDKQIEPHRHVEHFGENGGSAWEDFVRVSLNLDRTYNGVVFKRHEILDAPRFQVDEKPFRIICEELSDPTSPYNFATIPIHILGSIYEGFLGKIITDGARIVEKPEVRKAGGVYYTPEYIVRYIVANTVGKAIEGKTPAEIAEMHFADIACGSGSFLLEVFDSLLRYHAKHYNENPGKVKRGDCIQRDGGLHLSLKKKQEILRNNIYGVDIDRQAVEVAQLSLYLKLLEDETLGSAYAFQNEFHYTLLPPLTENIICGNSLIGPDILDTGKFSAEEEKKLNPLDFAQRFPKIFRRKTSGGELREASPGDVEHNVPGGMPLHGSYGEVSYRKKKNQKSIVLPEMECEGGFDAIVGNPPYVMVEVGKEKKYLQQNFETDEGKPDLYKYFIERAHKLLNSSGLFGMIIPASMLMTPAYKRCREFLLRKSSPLAVVSFQGQVFATAHVNSIILVTKNKSGNEQVEWIEDETPHPSFQSLANAEISQSLVSISAWKATNDFAFTRPKAAETSWIAKMKTHSQSLGNFGKYVLGMQIYHNSLHSKAEMENRIYHSSRNRGKGWLPESGGKNIRRYEFVSEFNEWAKYGDHCYHKPPPEFLSGPRIVVREITGKTLICAYTEEEHAPNKAVIIFRSDKTNLKFILGILNSRLIGYYVESTTEKGKQRLFPRISLRSFRELPIPQLDLKNSADKARHDKLVSLVEKMLEAKKQFPPPKPTATKIFTRTNARRWTDKLIRWFMNFTA